MFTSRVLPLVAIATMSLPLMPSSPVSAADARTASGGSVVAVFEGQTIRLADGWGDATACHQGDAGVRCYRTETEMDRAESSTSVGASLLASCSSSLKLYRSTGQTGGVLELTQRSVNIDLSVYGFSNDTESYRVGACGSKFYDATTGTGTSYPGSTGAYASASSMLSGWANRVSSVRIS